jgi:hypothetical protein
MADDVRKLIRDRNTEYDHEVDEDLMQAAVLIGMSVYLIGKVIKKRRDRTGNDQQLKAV